MAEKPADAPKPPPAPQPEKPSLKPPRVVERDQKTQLRQRARPTLGPPEVVVHGAWGRALPAPRPGEREESIFTSWLMGLLGKPHPRALAEDEARKAARR